jgi:hypothetical protein
MPEFDTNKIISFLAEKWGDNYCPMCNAWKWQVQGKFFQLRGCVSENNSDAGQLITIIPVTCTNCGNTILINANISGSIESEAVL